MSGDNRAISLLTLRIRDKEVEQAYQSSIAERSLWRYRLALISGIVLFLVFILVDRQVYPAAHDSFAKVRIFFVTPGLLLVLLISFTSLYRKASGAFNLAAVFIAGMSFIFMALIGTDEPEISRLYVGLILLFFYLYAFMHIPWLHGLFIGVGLMTSYLAVSLYINAVPFHIFINMAFMTGASNLVGVTIAYIMEHYSKTEYLLRKRLSETVIKDALTGLYNRHYFVKFGMEDIRQFIERSQSTLDVERRHGQVKAARYGLFMVDIDHFKRVNDTFGHHSGDLVLKQFAQLLKENVRYSDDVLRFGGEEFLIVIKYTTEDFLIRFMKKLGILIEEHDFLIEGGSVIGCTASIGLAVAPDVSGASVESLVRYADRALYRSKETGRNRGNRAICHDGEMFYEEIGWYEEMADL